MRVQPNSAHAATAAAAAASSEPSDSPRSAPTASNTSAAATPSGMDNPIPPGRTMFSEQAELQAQLHAISTQLGVLTEREQERAAHREAVIDRLHAENQALRRRELDLMLDPVRNGLYRLYDLARREAERREAHASTGSNAADTDDAAPLLRCIADEIAEVLARTGVEAFPVRPGEPYDPARHRPVDTEAVADPEADGTVLRVLSSGFATHERVTRRADVVVGQLTRRTHPQARSQAESESS